MTSFRTDLASAYALHYAVVLAVVRESPTLEVEDLLGGLYIATGRRVSKYWKNPKAFDRLMTNEPTIGKAISAYLKGELLSPATVEQIKLRQHFVPYSPKTMGVLDTAGDLGLSRGGSRAGEKPVLAPEDLLLAIAKHAELAIGNKLLDSGVDVERLERAVKKLRPRAV
jgi:hypothetical protein